MSKKAHGGSDNEKFEKLFCILLFSLSFMSMRCVCVDICNSSLFLFHYVGQSDAWVYHKLCIHSSVDSSVGCFCKYKHPWAQLPVLTLGSFSGTHTQVCHWWGLTSSIFNLDECWSSSCRAAQIQGKRYKPHLLKGVSKNVRTSLIFSGLGALGGPSPHLHTRTAQKNPSMSAMLCTFIQSPISVDIVCVCACVCVSILKSGFCT